MQNNSRKLLTPLNSSYMTWSEFRDEILRQLLQSFEYFSLIHTKIIRILKTHPEYGADILKCSGVYINHVKLTSQTYIPTGERGTGMHLLYIDIEGEEYEDVIEEYLIVQKEYNTVFNMIKAFIKDLTQEINKEQMYEILPNYLYPTIDKYDPTWLEEIPKHSDKFLEIYKAKHVEVLNVINELILEKIINGN